MVQGPRTGMECHYTPDEGWGLNAFGITTDFSSRRARDETLKDLKLSNTLLIILVARNGSQGGES